MRPIPSINMYMGMKVSGNFLLNLGKYQTARKIPQIFLKIPKYFDLRKETIVT